MAVPKIIEIHFNKYDSVINCLKYLNYRVVNNSLKVVYTRY